MDDTTITIYGETHHVSDLASMVCICPDNEGPHLHIKPPLIPASFAKNLPMEGRVEDRVIPAPKPPDTWDDACEENRIRLRKKKKMRRWWNSPEGMKRRAEMSDYRRIKYGNAP